MLADDELQLQEQLKLHPELLPLEELGLAGPAVVVGRESALDSGRVDLVLLGNGGDLALVEFKTGPQNPDFRECLAQMLDYGSDLWGMTLEEFETRVAQRYFSGPHCPPGTIAPSASLDQVLSQAWGTAADDAWTGESACGPSFATAASSTLPWPSGSRRPCCARSGT